MLSASAIIGMSSAGPPPRPLVSEIVSVALLMPRAPVPRWRIPGRDAHSHETCRGSRRRARAAPFHRARPAWPPVPPPLPGPVHSGIRRHPRAHRPARAVRESGKAAQFRQHRWSRQRQGLPQRQRRECVGGIVSAGEPHGAHGQQRLTATRQPLPVRLRHERVVRVGIRTQRETQSASRRLDHGGYPRIVEVHDRHFAARVDAGLGAGIGIEVAVAVQVIGCHVEHHRRCQ